MCLFISAQNVIQYMFIAVLLCAVLTKFTRVATFLGYYLGNPYMLYG